MPVSVVSDKLMALLVEDEDISAEYMSLMLKSMKVNFQLARNGAEALEIFDSNPTVSLVFMDIRLPVVSGYEAIARLRSKRPDMRIVALTAFALENDRKKAFEEGCSDFLSKPVSRDDLLKVISRHCDPCTNS